MLGHVKPIDIVVTWVNDNDKKWLDNRKLVAQKHHFEINETRYRDYGLIKYFFRSIDKYCPWVNQVFFITDHQIPKWLDLNNEKLRIVFHEDFIPLQYLPTYNSNVIELNLFRIHDLSEQFILFNDDTLATSELSKSDFFLNSLPRQFGVYDILPIDPPFSFTLINDLNVINHHFKSKGRRIVFNRKFMSWKYGKYLLKNICLLPWNKISGYYNAHLPMPHLKSTFQKVYNLEADYFLSTFHDRFRMPHNEINHWLMGYWNIEEERFEPQNVKIGEFVHIDELNKVDQILNNGKTKLICLNDVDMGIEKFNIVKKRILQILEQKFPEKSTFEK